MRFLLACFVLLGFYAPAIAEDWAGFRGSHGDGTTTESSTPVSWNQTNAVRWTAPLPQGGNGSPIVVGDRVFVTSAEDDKGMARALLCFDADVGGAPMWRQTVNIDRQMPTHKTNPYAGSTPASDGKTIVVWHASAGLFAYDMQGHEKWSRQLGEYKHMWGYGSSPIISGDRVILHTGPGKQVFVIAFDLENGEELWRHEEPVEGSGERNAAGQYMGSWSTPVLIEGDGRTIAVCALATRVCGFDVQTGELIWYCEGLRGERGDLAYSSPMIEGDLCVMFGGFQGPAMGFQIAGTGNLTEKHRLWRIVQRNPQSIGTGMIVDGYVYRLGAGPNTIDCLDPKTGEVIWQQRSDMKAFWSSIAFNGRNAYATDQAGTTLVFEPSPDGFKEVAKNRLGDTCNATPALSGGRVYIRTYKQLWCIGE